MSQNALIRTLVVFCTALLLSTPSTQASEYFKNLQPTFNNGPIEGILLKSTCPKREASCEGYCEWIDGRKYTGEFKYGKPEGWGTLTWQDGAEYEGQFKEGQRHGKGRQSLLNGDIYEGEWIEGYMSGKGSYAWADGTYYNGEFAKDKMDGEGKINLFNGESYSGSWKAGFADGEGTYILVDGTKYMGHFRHGKRHGQGVITWTTGDVLMGSWVKGHINKESSFKFTNGDSYTANWKKGALTNKGIYKVLSDQRTITGDILTIENETISNEALFESVSPNIGLVLYAMALEFKFNKDFKLAKHYMLMAQKYVTPSSDINKLIHYQLDIVEEKLGEM